jgi:hypothetical protein
MTAMLANNLGDVSQRLGNLDEAKVYLREGLQVAQQIGATPLMLTSIQSAATLITLAGDSDRGLALLGLTLSHPASSADHKRTAADCFEFLQIDGEKAARIARLVFYLGAEIGNTPTRPQWNPESRAAIVGGQRR